MPKKIFLLSLGFLFLLGLTGAPVNATSSSDSPSAPTIQLKNFTFDPLSDSAFSESGSALPDSGDNLYIIQFTGPVLEDWKNTVSAQGAKLYGYIPDFAFLARMDSSTAQNIQSLDFVRWVGPYQPDYRMSADLAMTTTGQSGEISKVNIETLPDADLNRLAEQIQSLGGVVEGQSQDDFAGYLTASIPSENQGQLASLTDVVYIEPHYEMQLSNDIGGAGIMRAAEVRQNLGLYGAGQIVAVADTGLDTGNIGNIHPDVSGRVLQGIPLGRASSWSDLNGHGTHVAGSVLGNGAASGSNPAAHSYNNSYAGVAPEAQLIFQSVEDSSGSLSGIPDNVGDLFRQVYPLGARIHTNSWGGPTGGTSTNPTYGGYTVESQQVDAAAWQMKDLTILFSAGNDGVDNDKNGVIDRDSIGEPGTAKNAITVGASENLRPQITKTWISGWPSTYNAYPISRDKIADNSAGMAAFSSRGPTDDGRIKPDIVAPGTFIASTRSSLGQDGLWGTMSYWGLAQSGDTIDQHYIMSGGTSMSTPLTAGAAAVVREWLVRNRHLEDPSSALIKALLLNGAADIHPGQYGNDYAQEIPSTLPNPVSGWGRVDLANSILTSSGRSRIIYDNTTGISTGQTATYQVNVGASADPSTTMNPVVTQADSSSNQEIPSARNDTSQQLLSNTGFEDNSGWVTGSDASYSTSYASSGSRSMKVTSSAKYTSASFYQLVDIPNDISSAQLSFNWMSNPAEIIMYSNLMACVSTADLSTKLSCSYLAEGDTSWHQGSNIFTQTLLDNVRGQRIAIEFYIYTKRPPNTFYVDDVRLDITHSTATPTAQPTAQPTSQPTAVQPTSISPTAQPTAMPTPQTGGPFKVNLVWTDYPGSVTAARALVNDLDLEVIASDGTHYYGNSGVYSSGSSCLRDGKWDRCNNAEGITLLSAQNGNYVIHVSGYNVPQGGRQPFALVISADGTQQTNNYNLFLPAMQK